MTPRSRFAFWSVALWLVRLGVFAASAADFPAPGNVAIVVGIAGDSETEKSYEDSLNALLGTFAQASSNKPSRIFLLSDLKTSIPNGLVVEQLESNRKSFLALSDKVKGVPLTVFAWGHGGMQGKSPVFHVRGPRLTPDDFAGLAKAAGEKSDWIMMFIGSGDFARAIRAEGRRVVTSEGSTRFSSDPIGMSLFVRTLTNASGDLDALGQQFGAATVKYYDERKLVRVEEPTLWLGAGDPRKLASDTPLEPGTSKPAQTSSSDSAVDWTKMSRVEAKDFPDDAGVVLRQKISYVLGETTASTEEREEVVQILTEEGKELGDFDISFSPPEENLEILACEILKPSGNVEKIDPDSIREVNQKTWAEYEVPSRKIFSIPGIAPGALLHIHFRRSWKHFPLPHVCFEIGLGGKVPVLKTTIEVRLSDKSAFHFAWRDTQGADPKIESRKYSQIYRWELARADAVRPEPLTAPHHEPALLISTFPDWADFSGWVRRLIKLANDPTPEIAEKARELTTGATSETEKARALFEFVTSLRYVAVPLGVNSFRPHAAANVFRNRFGDCKDKANLLNTMLGTLGIQADLVLVPRFSQAHEATPGLGFNHAISRIKLDGQYVWADSTDDVCRFGLLPPGDPGRNVLVIDDSTKSLTRLPEGGPESHRLEIVQAIDLTEAQPRAKIDVQTLGFFDYAFRSVVRESPARQTGLPVVASLLRARSGDLRLTEQRFTPPSSLGDVFQWSATASYSSLVTPLPGSTDRLLSAPLSMPSEWNLADQRRTRPLFINQGYPGKIDERITFQLPAKVGDVRLPEPVKGNAEIFSWSIEWTKPAPNHIQVHATAIWPRGDLTQGETLEYQEALRQYRAAADVPAVLVNGGSN